MQSATLASYIVILHYRLGAASNVRVSIYLKTCCYNALTGLILICWKINFKYSHFLCLIFFKSKGNQGVTKNSICHYLSIFFTIALFTETFPVKVNKKYQTGTVPVNNFYRIFKPNMHVLLNLKLYAYIGICMKTLMERKIGALQ